MYEIKIKPFIDMQDLLVQWSIIGRSRKDGVEKFSSRNSKDNFAKWVRPLIAQMQAPEFHVCRRIAETFLEHLEGNANGHQLLLDAEQLRTTLLIQIDGLSCVALSPSEREYFAPSRPLFGQAVADRFPSILDEVDEAGKCMALGRSTAAAFHSIRCLEAGIRGLARCLGIPDPTRGRERTWGKVLSTIKDDLERRWPHANQRMTGDGELFAGLYAALAAIQNPYRDATMHLVAKYTPDEALHIFEMVKGLMTKIASRMDENGEPKLP